MSVLISLNNKMDSSCVQILEIFVEPNQLFVITKEYDMNMTTYLDQQRSNEHLFSEDILCNNFNQLLETLKLIHNVKKPHMDIKPNNIFMNNVNNKWLYGDAFLLLLYESNDSKQMQYECNFNYIAPEVIEGKKYDLKCDCWSLGCILFEILTLEQAFPESPVDHEPDFSKIWDGYSKMYSKVVFGLLNPDPEKRLNVEGALSIMQKGRSLN